MHAQMLFVVLLTSTLAVMSQAQTCSNVYETFTMANPQCRPSGGFEADLRDLYCDETCGTLYRAFTFSVCAATFSRMRLWDYYTSHCMVNANGRPCYSFYNGSTTDMSVANNDALLLCTPSIQNGICSDDCRNRLTAIGDYYGSCINSVFNSSYFHSFNYELLPLFAYSLWNSCGVPIPVQVMTTTTAQPVPTTQPAVTTTLAPPVAATTVGVPAVPTTMLNDDGTTTGMAAEDDETTTDSVVGVLPTSSAINQLNIATCQFVVVLCAMSAALLMK